MSNTSKRRPLPLPPRAVVAVLRASTAEHFLTASQVMWDAGITCFEFTLTPDGALDALVGLRGERCPAPSSAWYSPHPGHLDAAAQAGAAFAVSQFFLPEFVAAATRCARSPYVPGALTPTEVVCGVEHRCACGQGVPDRVGRWRLLPRRSCARPCRTCDHAHGRGNARSGARIPRRRRSCRRSQRRIIRGRPARRRPRCAENVVPGNLS